MSSHSFIHRSVFCQSVTRGELDAIQIQHPKCSATLLLQGAQLLEFIPSSTNRNLLWLSPDAEYKPGKSIRGGIPVCWPWFGAVEKNPAQVSDSVKKPIAHGFARNLNWQLAELKESCHQVEIVLALSSNETTHQYWPYEFELQARFIFAEQLTLELVTTNKDAIAFNISQALHTYLPTQDIKQTQVIGFSGLKYIDALDSWCEKTQTSAIQFKAETDRLYQAPQNILAISPDNKVLLQTENSTSAVVWNPWIKKSQGLSQFADDAYQRMFCIETANVLWDIKEIKAGASQTLTLTLSDA